MVLAQGPKRKAASGKNCRDGVVVGAVIVRRWIDSNAVAWGSKLRRREQVRFLKWLKGGWEKWPRTWFAAWKWMKRRRRKRSLRAGLIIFARQRASGLSRKTPGNSLRPGGANERGSRGCKVFSGRLCLGRLHSRQFPGFKSRAYSAWNALDQQQEQGSACVKLGIVRRAGLLCLVRGCLKCLKY